MTLALLALGFSAGPARADLPLRSVDGALENLHEFDRGLAVEVAMNETANPRGAKLFVDLAGDTALHPSYDATYDFCQQFDPYNKTDSEVSDEAIDTYLETVMDTGPILEAFFVTGRDTKEDLKKAWFRGGRGFEHIICGETGKGSKLGGYHFWYLHYRYEREGRAEYLGADYGNIPVADGIADTRIATGKMSFDPDGPGGRRPLVKKPRGGFTVGNSVAAMLAAGHLAAYGNKLQIRAMATPAETLPEVVGVELMGAAEGVFHANLNGKTYPWTFHKVGQHSVRTLWPRFVR